MPWGQILLGLVKNYITEGQWWQTNLSVLDFIQLLTWGEFIYFLEYLKETSTKQECWASKIYVYKKNKSKVFYGFSSNYREGKANKS